MPTRAIERPRVTAVLRAVHRGEPQAWSRLIPLVERDLRRIARARLARLARQQSLCVTDLLHETYVRLLDRRDAAFRDRRHFFAAVARAMQCLLVDHARRRCCGKRGGGMQQVPLDDGVAVDAHDPSEVVALDVALRRLAAKNPQQHEVVLLRYFAGLSLDEVAVTIGASRSSVERQWRFARAWLHLEIEGER